MKFLPYLQTQDRILSQLQTTWASILNPLLKTTLVNGVEVDTVVATGTNVINHKLGRKPQGFFVTDINAAVTLYRSAEFNDLTLTLTSSGAATISLWVF